jgi:flagellar hook-associated protein 3 FlgL
MNSLDSLTAAGKDVNFNFDTRLSEIQDLDYTEAISRFSNYQTQLQAAQLSFKQINQLSLFNIL